MSTEQLLRSVEWVTTSTGERVGVLVPIEIWSQLVERLAPAQPVEPDHSTDTTEAEDPALSLIGIAEGPDDLAQAHDHYVAQFALAKALRG